MYIYIYIIYHISYIIYHILYIIYHISYIIYHIYIYKNTYPIWRQTHLRNLKNCLKIQESMFFQPTIHPTFNATSVGHPCCLQPFCLADHAAQPSNGPQSWGYKPGVENQWLQNGELEVSWMVHGWLIWLIYGWYVVNSGEYG